MIWGTLLSVGIAAVWYLPMYERHGYAFIDEFIIQQHFQRFISNKYQHPQPFYFFFWILPLMTLPWLPFFFGVDMENHKDFLIPQRHRDRRSKSSASPRPPFSSSPLLLFSIAWLLVPLVFFSFSGSKLPGYILPAVPAAVILTTSICF